MKKLIFLSIILVLGIFLSGCSQESPALVNVPALPISPQLPETPSGNTDDNNELYSKIGQVNKVYKAYNAARFFTGQEIQNIYGCKKVVFSAVLVEYDSLDAVIVEYVSNLPRANAAMHQWYEGVQFNPDETYVEFATYKDKEKDVIIAHEVRIFNGNFMDQFDGSCYAKAVTFDPTMTIDINNNKNVYTGKNVTYESDYAFEGNEIECYKILREFPDSLKKFGSLSQVYLVVNTDDEVLKKEMNSDQYYIQYYAVYNSFDDVTNLYCNNRKKDKNPINYPADIVINNEMKYIHFYYVFNKRDDSMAWARADITDPTIFPNMDFGIEIEILYFYDGLPDLYEKIKEVASAEYKKITEYPSELSKYGTLENVYAYVMPDGHIVTEKQGISWTQKTYIAEYTEFNATTNKVINKEIKNTRGYVNGHHYLYNEGKKYIELSEDFQTYKNFQCLLYDETLSNMPVFLEKFDNSDEGEFYDYITELAASIEE